MAVTKIKPIKSTLKKALEYIQNGSTNGIDTFFVDMGKSGKGIVPVFRK